MGTELWFLPIPDQSPLMERVKRDPVLGQHLSFYSTYANRETLLPGSTAPGEEDFFLEARQIYTANPRLHKRIFTLDRYYDMLAYLLSEKRRQGIFDDLDIGGQIIHGVEELPEYCEGGQGHRMRYIEAKDVLRFHEYLTPLTPEDLRKVYNPSDMEEKGVYKFFADRADDKEWGWTMDYFNVLKNGYSEAAAHGEALIVSIV